MDNNQLVFVLGLILVITIIITSLFTTTMVAKVMETAAIKANVAYYELNKTTGEIEFKYKQISEVE